MRVKTVLLRLAEIIMQQSAKCTIVTFYDQKHCLFFEKTTSDQKRFFTVPEILKILILKSSTAKIPIDSESDKEDLIQPEPDLDNDSADCLIQDPPMEEYVSLYSY